MRGSETVIAGAPGIPSRIGPPAHLPQSCDTKSLEIANGGLGNEKTKLDSVPKHWALPKRCAGAWMRADGKGTATWLHDDRLGSRFAAFRPHVDGDHLHWGGRTLSASMLPGRWWARLRVARPERAELPTFWVVTMADYVFAEITPDKRSSVERTDQLPDGRQTGNWSLADNFRIRRDPGRVAKVPRGDHIYGSPSSVGYQSTSFGTARLGQR